MTVEPPIDAAEGRKTRKGKEVNEKQGNSVKVQPCHTEYSIPTCGAKRGSLLGGCPIKSVFELGHPAKHIAKFGPHKEATAVSARPWALQDGLRRDDT